MERKRITGDSHCPLLSIIVPIYNAENYITECIESILTQSFSDFELILIDDGSSDNSGTICDEYKSQDDRIKVVHKHNAGVSIARNIALDIACGKWIAFADADDYYYPDALMTLCNTAVTNDVDVVLAGFNVVVNGKERHGASYKDYISEKPLCKITHPALWCYLFRTSIIQDNNIRFVPNLAYSEDRVFIFDVILHCYKIAFSSKCIYAYRRIATSVCSSTNGMKKAQHQFMAAHAMNKILNKLHHGTAEYNKVTKERNDIIMLGADSYITFSFSLKKYREYEKYYLKYFNNRWYLFLITIKALLTHYRRSFITFKPSVLGNDTALIDLSFLYQRCLNLFTDSK